MADDTNRLAGVAYIYIDGQSYMLAGEPTYRVSKVSRETLDGMDDVHGYAEKRVAGAIGATLRDARTLSVASINAMTNVTVVLELANGKMITGRNMWSVDAQEVNAADATFQVKFEGKHVEEA
jgi:hypothetical protein